MQFGVTLDETWQVRYPAVGGEEVDFIVNPADLVPQNAEEDGPENDEIDETANDFRYGGEVTMIQDQNALTVRQATGRDEHAGIVYAPGEGQHPIGIRRDPLAEFLAYPKLYCGAIPDFPTKVSLGARYKYELMHHDSRFRNSPDNILYKNQVLLLEKLSSSVNIAMRQGHGEGPVTAQRLLNENEVNNFVRRDAGEFLILVFSLVNLHLALLNYHRLSNPQTNSM